MSGAAVLLVLALSASVVSARSQEPPPTCGGPDEESHDPRLTETLSCGSAAFTSATFLQLFTPPPPRLPRNYTHLCLSLYHSDPTYTTTYQPVTLVFHSVEISPLGIFSPGAELHSIPLVATLSPLTSLSSPRYVPYPTSFVLTSPQRLFVGVKFPDCESGVRIGASGIFGDSLVYSRFGNGTFLRSAARSIAVRASSRFLPFFTPAEWKCETERFRDGTCDCLCGSEDPACLEITRNSATCNETLEVCLGGKCVSHGYNRTLSGCDNLTRFGSDGTCMCGCGDGAMVDPDCRDPFVPLDKDSCQGMVKPACDYGTEFRCIELCPESQRGDGTMCHCGCGGVLDPDCLNETLPNDCGEGFVCGAGGLKCLPSKWTCPAGWYANGSSCDCGCGAYDSDCDDPFLPITGCGNVSGLVCHYNATCVASKCGNGYAEGLRSEECDGGRGCRDCKCRRGYRSDTHLRADCVTFCGDKFLTSDEECDGAMFCNQSTCKCSPGHLPIPRSNGRCSGCGNGLVESGEECDVSRWCVQSTCTCHEDHPVNRRLTNVCSGCGNGVWDDGEECDGGDGCEDDCKCASGYSANSAPACKKGLALPVLVGICIGAGVLAVIVLASLIFVPVACVRRSRRASSKRHASDLNNRRRTVVLEEETTPAPVPKSPPTNNLPASPSPEVPAGGDDSPGFRSEEDVRRPSPVAPALAAAVLGSGRRTLSPQTSGPPPPSAKRASLPDYVCTSPRSPPPPPVKSAASPSKRATTMVPQREQPPSPHSRPHGSEPPPLPPRVASRTTVAVFPPKSPPSS